MLELIHNAIISFNHYRDTRRVKRACRMSVAQLQTFYEYFTANGGFSRNGNTPTINQTTDGTTRSVPESTTNEPN